MSPLVLQSFPRAILHVDGDSFFASCEVAKNPSLRGKPVITGKERGIASSMSYEAKARGVTRAMRMSEILRICPDAVILPSDYETYCLYSKRMYDVVRRYTDAVEEYSIDECFADLTGMQRPNNMSYEKMAEKIKCELDSTLGMTFSVGLSVNKVTAKMASKHKKPNGLTIAPGSSLHLYLAKTPINKIWGIGPNSSAYLRQLGIDTAYDFALRSTDWADSHLAKPLREIHAELNGAFVYPLVLDEKHDYFSISKTKTFTPPRRDRSFVFSELSKNLENAFIKLRRHGLYAKRAAVFLKTSDFKYRSMEITLGRAVRTPEEMIRAAADNFNKMFDASLLYRATGATLMELDHAREETMSLFLEDVSSQKVEKIHHAIDLLDKRYGKHTVYLGSSFEAMNKPAHKGERGVFSERKMNILPGETERKRLNLPFLGFCV